MERLCSSNCMYLILVPYEKEKKISLKIAISVNTSAGRHYCQISQCVHAKCSEMYFICGRTKSWRGIYL